MVKVKWNKLTEYYISENEETNILLELLIVNSYVYLSDDDDE